MRGKIREKKIPKEEQFFFVDDMKLRLSLAALADKYSEAIRTLIYKTYNDNELASLFRMTRNSGVYEKGGRSKVHRKIIDFPNAYVYDFCDTVLSQLYGPDWMSNPKALKHDLVRPWWVVNKL